MGVVLVVGVAAFLVLRAVLVPDGFGVLGHYRVGAIEDNARRPARYAGRAACADCHADVVETRRGSRHERIGCESCHGPLAAHVADPGASAATRPDTRSACLGCHAASAARPRAFPQVVAADHAPEGACTECHRAHAPAIR
jgi:hypothetical protein